MANSKDFGGVDMQIDTLTIVTIPLFDYARKAYKLGGVESYMRAIAKAANERGIKVDAYQLSDSEWTRDEGFFTLHGVKLKKIFFKSANQRLYEYAVQKASETGVILISGDHMNVKSSDRRAIVIEHGIAFDYPIYGKGLGFWMKTVEKLLRCVRNAVRFQYVNNTVCVDYNHFNWLRTIFSPQEGARMKVIPNFCSNFISESELKQKFVERRTRKKRIVFARRFVWYRGTEMFANVVERLLGEFSDIEITFAGEGPQENILRRKFGKIDSVKITSFHPDDTFNFHKDYDIAVVPTICSEGTSLSLIEAMGAGCLPVCTHVGGMTNIVVDGFNGFMSYPDEDAFYETMRNVLLLEDVKFDHIVQNARETAKMGLNYESWSEKWIAFMERIVSPM